METKASLLETVSEKLERGAAGMEDYNMGAGSLKDYVELFQVGESPRSEAVEPRPNAPTGLAVLTP